MLDDVLRRLLPPWVAVHVAAYDERAPAAGELPPEVARAVPKRRAEFIAGRACARAALAAAGGDGGASIPIGPLRAPQWPPGFVGSITHAAGVAAAAVAPSSRTRALGIDLEVMPAPADVAATVATPAELALAPLTALFACKEALFKALAPRVGRYFDFLDVAAIAGAGDRLTFRQLGDLSTEFPAGTLHEAAFAAAGDRWMVAAVHLAW